MTYPGEDEYKDAAAVIFNYIRSSLTGFKPSLLMPWLETTNEQNLEMSGEDEWKVILLDSILRRMVLDNIISDGPTSPSASNKRGKFTISPRLNKNELRYWEMYTSKRGVQYQWIKAVFKSRGSIPVMDETLKSIERYLRDTKANSATNVSNAGKDDASNLMEDANVNRHRPMSIGSDTTNGSDAEVMPLSTSNLRPPPNDLHSSLNRNESHSHPPSQTPRQENGAIPKTSTVTGSSTSSFVPTPVSKPINAAIATNSPPIQQTQENTPPVRSTINSEPPLIPSFITQGLARLHEKYPDDEFEPTFDGNLWLIKCFDCEQGSNQTPTRFQKVPGIYKPNYLAKSVNNFEIHLENRKHTDHIAAKLARLGKTPTITDEVRRRMKKAEYQKTNDPSPTPASFDIPTFPTERQFKALSAREKALPHGDARMNNGFVVEDLLSTSQSPAYPESPSLVVTLGPFESLKRPSLSRPESTDSIERVKRRRLSQHLLEKVQLKNEDLASRVEKLESFIENSKKKDGDLDTRLNNMGAFNKTLYDNFEVSRKRIDGLENSGKATAYELDQSTKSIWDFTKRNNVQIEELKKSIAAISASSSGVDNSQIERVMSKALEMEQSFKELQEKCASHEQRLDGAAQAEQEMRERLMMVQKLALRQAEAMKEVNKEKEETGRRFARLEAMIESQAREKIGWNESLRTTINRNTDEILNCQTESDSILARVEKLEKERDEIRAGLRTPNPGEDGMTRMSPRRSGGRRM